MNENKARQEKEQEQGQRNKERGNNMSKHNTSSNNEALKRGSAGSAFSPVFSAALHLYMGVAKM